MEERWKKGGGKVEEMEGALQAALLVGLFCLYSRSLLPL